MPFENTPPRSPQIRPDPRRSVDDFDASVGESDSAAPGRRRGGRVLRSVVLIVLLGLVVAAGFTAWGLRRFSEITFVDIPGVEPPADGSAGNWLLIGTDGREGIDPDSPDAAVFLGEQVVGKRTDTIMLARVDGAAGTIDLMSVPRDLWVPIAGRDGNGRINGAYNGDDGRARLVATLKAALGVEINYYAEVNFVGFQEIVDALEGVPLWFDHPTRDSGSGLNIAEPGCHILDGSQALAYARGRTYEELIDGQWRLDPTGDLGRTTRQRIFLSRIIDTATATFDVTNLGTLNEVLGVGGRNLVVEDGASVTDLLSLARTFASVGGERIVGHALPVEDFRTDGGAQVLRLRDDEARPVLDVFRTMPAPSGPSAAPEGDSGGADSGSDSSADGGSTAVGADVAVGPLAATVGAENRDGYGRYGFVPALTPEGTPCG